MDNISDLLQEAKPLYFKRKRLKNIAKSAGVLSVAGILFISALPKPPAYIYDFDNLADTIDMVQKGSVIEEIGLPVDEFGFLRIS